MEFHPGYHRFSKPLAATAAPTMADRARKDFIILKRCVQMQEEMSVYCSIEQNERNQKNRSERVLSAARMWEIEQRRKGKERAEA